MVPGPQNVWFIRINPDHKPSSPAEVLTPETVTTSHVEKHALGILNQVRLNGPYLNSACWVHLFDHSANPRDPFHAIHNSSIGRRWRYTNKCLQICHGVAGNDLKWARASSIGPVTHRCIGVLYVHAFDTL